VKKINPRSAPKRARTVKDAIPSTYNGIEMKIRLEAQCAYLLDCFGWEWSYEPKSYMLPNGVPFTPDFLVTNRGLFIECRGYDTKKGAKQLIGFAGLMKNGIPAIEDEPPVDTFMVIFGDRAPIHFEASHHTRMILVVHCADCGWYPGQFSKGSVGEPSAFCQSCIAPIALESWAKWDGKARIDACAVITVVEGKILVNGAGSEFWGWISELGPGRYNQE
jgi:hypothetical protein